MHSQDAPGNQPARRTFLRLGSLVAVAPLVAAVLPATATAAAATTAAGGSDPLALKIAGGATESKILMEGLALGNGSLGALVGGAVNREVLELNLDSMWTGGTNPGGVYEQMGEYLSLAKFSIDFDQSAAQATGYTRTLDLNTAVAVVDYSLNGTSYRRESIASFPAQAVLSAYTASSKGAYSGRWQIVDGGGGKNRGNTAQIASGMHTNQRSCWITLANKLPNGRLFAVNVRIEPQGGKVTASNGWLDFSKVDSFLVIITAGTDYTADIKRNFRTGVNPAADCKARGDGLSRSSFDSLKNAHIADYQQLFNRQHIDLGSSTAAQLAKDTYQRVTDNKNNLDPALYALYYQFGRYLMISSSRPGSLPANLQGIWNNSNTPPWSSDYHTDINVQMCYWLNDPAGLGETFDPLLTLLESQIPSWRNLTQAKVRKPGTNTPVRGWTVRVSHNIDGGMGWEWVPTGSAWYSWHLWDHYTYTLDQNYLKRIYPILLEICQYLQDILVDDGKGKLVVPDSWSPEQTMGKAWRNTKAGFESIAFYHEDGVSMDQEFAWMSFNNFIQAADVLGLDSNFRNTAAALRDKLHLPLIGSWGQFQEWYDDKDEKTNTHRHISHLVGLFPSDRVTLQKTPELAAAAKVTLNARGIGPTGWSAAWGANCWATLREPQKAMAGLQNLLNPVPSSRDKIEMTGGGGVYPNLFDAHPPFQIDGNFGGAHAIIQMLMQSSLDTIDLLPALPAEWPNGSFSGLRARGAFSLDLSWQAGKLNKVTLTSLVGGTTTVSYAGRSKKIGLAKGASVTLDGSLNTV